MVELDETSPSSPKAFRVSEWGAVFDTEMSQEKPAELGHNDLHLETPGQWSLTLYPDIYGVPEDFLQLLSAVTRLGNERDLAHSDSGQQTCTWTQFNSRAKMVERCILHWNPSSTRQPSDGIRHDTQDPRASNEPVLMSHLRSMHQALTIYFYRRVHDLHPLMLQGRVLDTLNALEKCGEIDRQLDVHTTLFIWPALVSACECLDTDTQIRWTRWFDSSYELSRLSKFRQAKEVVQKVWAKRAQSGDQSIDWLKFCRLQQIRVMCI